MRRNPNKASLWLALPVLAAALILTPAANAAMINIDVLVEDAGGGTFTLVDTIRSFDNSGESAEDTYNYGGFSFNGVDTITPESDKSQIFFVMNDNGLNLYWVHDARTDNTGGTADTTLEIMGGPDLDFIFEDEGNDSYSASPAATLDAVNTWTSNGFFTDGYVAGGLNTTEGASWMLFANFNSESGLNAWSATSSTGDQVDLSSYLSGSNSSVGGLRVKFQLSENQTIPEPGTMALFGIGLIGLVGLRRRKK